MRRLKVLLHENRRDPDAKRSENCTPRTRSRPESSPPGQLRTPGQLHEWQDTLTRREVRSSKIAIAFAVAAVSAAVITPGLDLLSVPEVRRPPDAGSFPVPQSPASSGIFSQPYHQQARRYLETLQAQGNLSSFYGACTAFPEPHRTIKDHIKQFTYSISSSSLSGDAAMINIQVATKGEPASAYVVALQEESKEWKICSVASGHREVEVD